MKAEAISDDFGPIVLTNHEVQIHAPYTVSNDSLSSADNCYKQQSLQHGVPDLGEVKMMCRLLRCRKIICVLYGLILLHGCVDSGNGLSLPLIPDGSPGGIWLGTDSNGDAIFALITEDGRFHFLDITTRFQGFGILNVSDSKEVTAGYQLVPALGFTFADGSLVSDCDATGTLDERKTLNMTIICTTSQGSQESVTVDFFYDAHYDVDSDLATFSGDWTFTGNPGFDIVSVDANGIMTGQDGNGTNCVYSGQVSIIDPDFNAYNIEWGYANCTGEASVLNGVTFNGIGAINNIVSPNELIFGGTGTVQGTLISWILTYEKI